MPKYLLEVSYTSEGIKGVHAQGGSARKKAAQEAAKSLGGTLESIFFAFGDTDVYAIGDFPDNSSCAALALALGASGSMKTKTVVLLTPEEIDSAVKREVSYRPPGK